MKKKLISLIVSVATLMSMFTAVPVYAADAGEGDCWYSEEYEATSPESDFGMSGSTIKSYFGDMETVTELVIPPEINGVNVETLGCEVFGKCYELEKVVIPDGVEYIDISAFYYCTSLKEIYIPATVTGMGYSAFEGCEALETVYYGGTVSEWEEFLELADYSSRECLENAMVVCKDGTAGKFTDESSLSGEESVRYAGNSDVELINIPYELNGASVKVISSYAFGKLYQLRKVMLPVGVTRIQNSSFANCTALEEIVIPYTLTTVDNNSIYNCPSLGRIIYIGNESQWDDFLASVTDSSAYKIFSSAEVMFTNPEISDEPTQTPSASPTAAPTVKPTATPTAKPTATPTAKPTATPTAKPTATPTAKPTATPTAKPTATPKPTAVPTPTPTAVPTPVPTIAPTPTPEPVLFTITADGLITGYLGEDTDMVIPETVNGITVKGIADRAFSGNTSITSVVLPDTAKVIGKYAFYGASSLESVVFPDGLTGIGNSAFNDCVSLTSVSLPGSLTDVGTWIFAGCKNITEVELGYGIIKIGERMFSGTAIEGIEIPDTVECIDAGAFEGCKNLISIVIPEKVTVIADNLFHNCSLLESVEIRGNVTSVGKWAFGYCKNLKELTLPGTVTSIGRWAIYQMNNLETIYFGGTYDKWRNITVAEDNDSIDDVIVICSDMPALSSPSDFSYTTETVNNSFTGTTTKKITITGYRGTSRTVSIPSVIDGGRVVKISNSAFYNKGLTAVALPNCVKEIGKDAFEYNSGMTKFYMPSRLTTIGDSVFVGCNISNIYVPAKVSTIGSRTFYGTGYIEVDEANEYYCSVNGVLYSKDMTRLVGYPGLKRGAYTVPGTVEAIEASTFWACSGLSSITLSEGVKSIGKSGIGYCTSLKTVYLPSTIETIGASATNMSTSITDVYYNGTRAQWNEITIDTGNENLLNATLHCTDDPIFEYENGIITKYIGEDSSVIIPTEIRGETITGIGDGVFHGTYVTDIVIPEGIRTIGDGAFSGTYISEINIPSSVTGINYNAFQDCPYLETITVSEDNIAYSTDGKALFSKDMSLLVKFVTNDGGTYQIPSTVVTVGDYAFMSTYLTGVNIPSSVKTLGYSSLSHSYFYQLVIPDTVETIGDFAFEGNYELRNVVLPQNITAIGNGWFYKSANLQNVDIPNGVTSIGDEAFYGCGINILTVPNSVTYIGENAFYYSGIMRIRFMGTQAEWNCITFGGKDNSYLNQITIIFNSSGGGGGASSGTTVAPAPAVSTGRNKEKAVEVTVEIPKDVEVTKETVVIVSGLQKDSYSEMKTLNPSDGNTLTMDNKGISYVKVFVWESLESMIPLTEPILVEIKD